MYKSEEIFTLLACSVSILICVSGASVNGLLFHMSVEEHHIVFHLPSISINRFCSSEFTQVHFNFERKGCSSFFDLFSFACANGCPLLCAHRWVTEWPVMRYTDEDNCWNWFSKKKRRKPAKYVARCSLCQRLFPLYFYSHRHTYTAVPAHSRISENMSAARPRAVPLNRRWVIT